MKCSTARDRHHHARRRRRGARGVARLRAGRAPAQGRDPPQHGDREHEHRPRSWPQIHGESLRGGAGVRPAAGRGAGPARHHRRGTEGSAGKCEPLFKVLGKQTFIVGEEPAKANAVKIARNFLLATVIESLGEAFALVRKCGVAPHDFLKSWEHFAGLARLQELRKDDRRAGVDTGAVRHAARREGRRARAGHGARGRHGPAFRRTHPETPAGGDRRGPRGAGLGGARRQARRGRGAVDRLDRLLGGDRDRAGGGFRRLTKKSGARRAGLWSAIWIGLGVGFGALDRAAPWRRGRASPT